jgi:adenylate cyclase
LVISRESSFSFRDKELGAQQIGAELGVRFVLEGSVRKAEDRIRVNVQLIDTEQEGHVWAEKYDRDLTDVLIVQDEIVRSVVSTLGEKIWQSAAVAVQRKPLGSFDAYDLELKGLEALHKFTPENNQRAREYFNSAIASDPEYSQSYIGLAWTYLLDYIYQWTDSGSQVLDLAFQAAQDADKAGSSKDHVLRILARINNLRGNNEKALDQITSALEYNPNDGDLLVSKAMLLTFAGRSEEAVPWLEDAMARNPRDFPVWWASVAGSTYYMQRDYRRAISIINRLSKPSVRESRLLAASYAQLGEMNEAKRYVDKVLEVSPNFTLSAFVEKLPYGAERDAEHFLEGLRKAGFPD